MIWLQFSEIIFIILVASIFIIYYWIKYQFNYWEKRGVVGPKPIIPFGNLMDVVRRKTQPFQPYCDNYIKYKHLPYVGMYSFLKPVLSIHDPDIARLILIKDYDHFQTHGVFHDGKRDPLSDHLFNLYGTRWKNLRSKLSPSFTIGKLKTMYPLVEKTANTALNSAEKEFVKGNSINFTEFYARFVMDIIGNVGFGVEFNGINNTNSDFYNYCHKYLEPSNAYWTFIWILSFFAPELFKKLGLKRIRSDVLKFFTDLVNSAVEYRKKNSYRRNDFLQTLIDLKEETDTGRLKNEDDFLFSNIDILSNTMLYMIAGYETSAITGQMAAYELARNPEIQARAREEVLTVLARHGGQYTYEAQNEMVYMNMLLDETMRIHPPMRSLFRKCTEDYIVPQTGLVIEKGTQVFVPIQAIQMDPDIYSEPEKFDPERFSPEKKAQMHPCHWMPFGEGPRKCLGLRQGYIQSKLALVKILQNYELTLDERTKQPPQLKVTSFVYGIAGDVWVKLKLISKSK